MWKLYYSKRAQKQLRKLDPSVARILVQWLNRNVDGAIGPRAKGRSLTGYLSEKWPYWVGGIESCAASGDLRRPRSFKTPLLVVRERW